MTLKEQLTFFSIQNSEVNARNVKLIMSPSCVLVRLRTYYNSYIHSPTLTQITSFILTNLLVQTTSLPFPASTQENKANRLYTIAQIIIYSKKLFTKLKKNRGEKS